MPVNPCMQCIAFTFTNYNVHYLYYVKLLIVSYASVIITNAL